ncbi:Uncharacterised protein [Escherichia coli]|nr:Uncharacterised protein [Escherichia coli]
MVLVWNFITLFRWLVSQMVCHMVKDCHYRIPMTGLIHVLSNWRAAVR